MVKRREVKCRRTRLSRDRRGIVLYLVLVIALLLLAAGAVLGVHLQKRMGVFRDQQRNVHAQALLDSATAVAMSLIHQDFKYQGVVTQKLDKGEVKIEVRFGAGSGLRDVLLTAQFRGETRRAEVRIQAEKGRPPKVLRWRPVPGSRSG